jgi:O-antigen/teichoic acid export membrane protein
MRLSFPRKHRRRVGTVLIHSFNNLFLPLSNVLVSLLVVRLASAAVWGSFVPTLLVMQLAAHIINWGNKEYLLRAISRQPGKLAELWQGTFFTRWLLCLAFMGVMTLWGWPASWLLLIWLWGVSLMVAQSLEPLVLYRRDFVFSFLVEFGASLVLIAWVTILGVQLTVNELVTLFTFTQLGKAAVLLLRFHAQLFSRVRARFDPAYFRLAFPFFMLGFTGMVQSRIDLYSVSYFMDQTEVGQYQVLAGFLLYIHAFANFFLLPFVKSIYRLKTAVINKISWRLFGLGLLVVPPSIGLVDWVLRHLYHFDLSPLLLIVGGLRVLPIFFTLPIIYALYKADLQRQVLYVNLVNIALNIGMNILWIPRWGVLGALLSTTLTSWLALTFYWYRGRQLLRME